MFLRELRLLYLDFVLVEVIELLLEARFKGLPSGAGGEENTLFGIGSWSWSLDLLFLLMTGILLFLRHFCLYAMLWDEV